MAKLKDPEASPSNEVLQTIIVRKEVAPTPTQAFLLAKKYGRAISMLESKNTWRFPQLVSQKFRPGRRSERPASGIILVYGRLWND